MIERRKALILLNASAGTGRAGLNTWTIIKKFAETVLEDINPRDSWRAGKALRQHISVVMAERALRESIILAGGVVNG